MTFEIVNHTYNYSRLLAYQLSSLIIHHSQMPLIYTLYYDPADAATVTCCNFYSSLIPSNVTFNRLPMPLPYLKNRAIGRNASARISRADWIWFTDTDYCFQDRCWDMLTDAVKDTSADLVWPHTIRETDWNTGDRLIKTMNTLGVRDVPLTDSVDKRMNRAIGGVQIVRASYARDNGYCPDMTDACADWNFKSDVRFRRSVRRVKEISLWHVTRIRHEAKGYGNEQPVEVIN